MMKIVRCQALMLCFFCERKQDTLAARTKRVFSYDKVRFEFLYKDRSRKGMVKQEK